MNPAIFIDKDGTLIKNVPYNVNPQLIQLEPEAPQALVQLKAKGFQIFMISNQPGVALGYFREDDLRIVKSWIDHLLNPYDIRIDGFYYCPHHPLSRIPIYKQICECRKPNPGLILKAASEHQIDLENSWMIGDILNDIESGQRAGCRTILINNGNETEWCRGPCRDPDYNAKGLIDAAYWIMESLSQTGSEHKKRKNHELE